MIEAIDAALDALSITRRVSLLRSQCGETEQPTYLLPTSNAGCVAAIRGGATRATAVDVVTGLLRAIQTLPEPVRTTEEDSVLRTMRNLLEESVDLVGGLAALQSRVYGLQAAVPDTPGIQALVLDSIELLEQHGVQTIELDRGQDARPHEGRFHVTPGARHWHVAAVRRPCLLQQDRVLQIGIVDTD